MQPGFFTASPIWGKAEKFLYLVKADKWAALNSTNATSILLQVEQIVCAAPPPPLNCCSVPQKKTENLKITPWACRKAYVTAHFDSSSLHIPLRIIVIKCPSMLTYPWKYDCHLNKYPFRIFKKMLSSSPCDLTCQNPLTPIVTRAAEQSKWQKLGHSSIICTCFSVFWVRAFKAAKGLHDCPTQTLQPEV